MNKENLVFGFDYDGTIINIEPQKAGAFGEILNRHWGVDRQEAASFWIETGGTSRRYKFDYFYKQQYGGDLIDDDYRVIEQVFSRTLKTEYYPQIQLLPHALETLEFVREHFGYVFVSSGVPMKEINYLVKVNGVLRFFDIVLGTDNKFRSKRDHFDLVIKAQQPQLMFYLADGLEDMKVAQEFDVISIGLPTNHSQESLGEAGAKYVCDLNEVNRTVSEILAKQI